MSLFAHLSVVPDRRQSINKKHDLIDVIFLVFSAVLSGATGWKAIEVFGDAQLDWLRHHRAFGNGVPRRHCIANIVKGLDTDALMQALFGWINERRKLAGKGTIAIDGKTMRRAWQEDVQKALHVVSAYDVEHGVALYQQAAQSKGEEIKLARNIIDVVAAKGKIMTLDALHCQSETLQRIAEKKSDYIVGVKANQKTLHEWVQQAFCATYEVSGTATHEQVNRGHGREERRVVMQIPAHLPPELKTRWPSIRSLIEVSSERTEKGQTYFDSRWYVSSLEIDAQRVAQAIRDHWQIENGLHWVLDVAFKEDATAITDPEGAKHVALINRIALSVIRQHQQTKESVNSKRNRAAWSAPFRDQLIFG